MVRKAQLRWQFGVSLYRCVYVSSARLAPQHRGAQVAQIVDHAVAANAAMEITGALMFDRTRFAQLFEGPPLAVIPLARKIARDKRHDQVVFLEHQPVNQRLFEGCLMAYHGNSVFVERAIALTLDNHEGCSKYALRQLIQLMLEFCRQGAA